MKAAPALRPAGGAGKRAANAGTRAFAFAAALVCGSASAAEPPAARATPLRAVMAPAVQRASGVAVVTLAPVCYVPRVDAYARVVDVTPLFALRARLRAARARLVADRKEYERLKELNEHGRAASDQALQAAEAAWRSDQADVDRLRATALQRWGLVLTGWLEDRSDPTLNDLARASERLLSVSVPASERRVAPAGRIALPGGESASLVSPAPVVDPEIQAPVFFYRTGAALPADYRFRVAMPLAAKAETGVRVPESAVLWYGGKAWVYVRLSPAEFERRPIATDAPDGDGWFVTQNLAPGSALVVEGAELLYAQEFNASLPAGGAGDED